MSPVSYFKVREGASIETKEMLIGQAFADYDAAGMLLGVKLLSPCRVKVPDRINANPETSVRFHWNVVFEIEGMMQG